MIRSALLVSLILQALRLSLASMPTAEIVPTPVPASSESLVPEAAEADCSYDLPEDGSADALEIRRALNCWKSLGRPGGLFCPPGYGRFFNTSECWKQVYRFEVPVLPPPLPDPTPVPYPAPYP